MIDRKDLFNINFYKTDPFFGSYRGMNYRIIKFMPESPSDAADHEDDTTASPQEVLRVSTWPGPYIYDVTPDEQKVHADFPFSNDGLTEAADYLNQIWKQSYQN